MWEINRESDMHLSRRDREYIGILAVKGNQNAHTWNVLLWDDEIPVSPTGKTVKAVFVFEDGTEQTVNGSMSANTARVTIPTSVYAKPGMVRALMRVYWGARIVTVDAIVFRIAE